MPIISKSIFVAIAFLSIGFVGGLVLAQSGSGHMSHSEGATPIETGQSAFAAMAEIVKLLDDNPNTDWSKVNVTSLRNHLLDMNNLTLGTSVTAESQGMQVQYFVTGRPSAIKAAQNMIPAHALELDKMDVWSVSGEVAPNGATLTVSAKSEAVLAKVKALGFFGLMATGAHHQPHHLAMATGQMNNH